MAEFNSKSFNAEAFKYVVDRVPNLKQNELRKSKALAPNPGIKTTFTTENGTGYAKIVMRGLADGEAVNYDGETDITATSTKTFEQGVVVVGRAKAWVERDFSYDITGGIDFMENIANQVAKYKEGLDQKTLLAILKGVFSMTGTQNAQFVNSHTLILNHDIDAISLNKATNKACGANKKKFAVVIMHSDVATGLENLNLVKHLRYTDKDGIERELDLATWNGKIVLIDDDMPVIEGYFDPVYTSGNTTDEEYTIVADNATPTTGQIKLSSVTPYFGERTLAATNKVVKDFGYVTYVLGEGSISYEDIGAKVPYEMSRNASENGGEDTLYVRQRKCFAPYGISYTKTVQATNSPTDAELENGANWELVHSGESSANNRSYINHKSIPIARIISRVNTLIPAQTPYTE